MRAKVGCEYYLKWKLPDTLGFSGTLLAESAPFKATSMQSVLTEVVEHIACPFQLLPCMGLGKKEKLQDLAKNPARYSAESMVKLANAEAKLAAVSQTRQSSDGCSVAERKVFRKHFEAIDVNTSDSLSSDELTAYMKNYGFDITGDAMKKMMLEADIDSDGDISFREFCSILKKAQDLKTSKVCMVVACTALQ